MSVKTPANYSQPFSSRPNLEELAALLRSRKDRSGQHNRLEKTSQPMRKKSVSNKNDSNTNFDDTKKLRTQVESMLSKRTQQEMGSGIKVQNQMKSAKKTGVGNYFLTADVSNVLRAINLNMEGSLNRHKQNREMTEDDIDKLFAGSQSKNKKSNKQNDSSLNHRGTVIKKELLTSKGSVNGTANKLRKRDLVTECDVDFEVRKQETMKVGNLHEFLEEPEVEIVKPTLGKVNKDFAQSIRFLQIEDEPTDRLLNGLMNEGLVKMQEDQSVDKTAKFKSEFLVGKQIGEGAYASVRVAVFKPNNQKVAIKIYEKKKIKELPRKKSVRRQIKILQKIDHPNIVRIYDVIETNNHVNIIMEYVSGISLASYLKAQPSGRICEKDARKIFKGLVDSIAYLHTQSISHRDIKLENVLLDGKLTPKLIDFGFATCIVEKVKIFCGTPSYMAPEIVLKTEYRGQPSDVWALGVLLYVMLTGIFPFKGQTDKQLYKKIVMSDYPKMEGVSRQASTLIARMLTIETEHRITAAEVLQDEWITGYPNKKQRSSSAAMRRELIKKASEETPKHCFELLENLVKRSSEKVEKTRNGQKMFAQTQKQNLRNQLRLANACQPASANWSPKGVMPSTCTNRNTIITALEAEQQKMARNCEVKKKSEQKLTNKRYF